MRLSQLLRAYRMESRAASLFAKYKLANDIKRLARAAKALSRARWHIWYCSK